MNVSSVKNLNGETFSAVQDLSLTNVVQTNSAVLTGMIDAKQDALTFGYDEQDRINAINNSALAGGGEVPEGTMVESNLEYNSQGYINGYNGSAVATIDQERQWFTHDDTLCHVSNSAQYALGINMSAISADLARMMGVDETVLLDKTWDDTLWNEPLAEPISAFKTVRFVLTRNDGANELKFQDYYTTGLSGKDFLLQNTVYMDSIYTYFTIAKFNGNNYQEISAHIGQEGTTGYSWQNVNCWCHPVKIIGIGRKS